MIGAISGRDVEHRQVASAAAAVIAAQNGASLLRVHDVAETVDALAVLRTNPFAARFEHQNVVTGSADKRAPCRSTTDNHVVAIPRCRQCPPLSDGTGVLYVIQW